MIAEKEEAKKVEYYKVLAKCGHVGRNRYILKWFYRKANSGEEAARIIRNTPRVKHHHKDAIREVVRIDYDEYINGVKIMASDMYFNVHNSTDQKLYNCIKQEDVYPEVEKKKYKKNRNGRRLKYEALEKEWKHIIKGGRIYDE